MMKILRTFLVAALSAFAAINAQAQLITGNWTLWTPFNGVAQILETPNTVYYTSEGNLFSYTPATQETYTFTVQNKLSDTGVNKIFYNPEDKYLLVTYTNGNIDILGDDGKVITMSDIRDAVLTSEKNINAVSFADGRIYVAADFGVVIFDGRKFVVIESGIYNKKVQTFVKSGDRYFLSTDNATYTLPADQRINSLSKFEQVTIPGDSHAPYQLLPLEGGKMLGSNQWHISSYEFNPDDMTLVRTPLFQDMLKPNLTYIQPSKDWYYIPSARGEILCVSKDGSTQTIALPSALKEKPVSFWKSPDKIWEGEHAGISQYEISGSEADLVCGPIAPGSITVPEVDDIQIASDGTVYFTQNTSSRYATADRNGWETPINRIRDGKVEVIEPDNIEFHNGNSSPAGVMRPKNNHRITINPDNSDKIYVGNWFEGVMVFDGNNYVATIDGRNSRVKDFSNGGIFASVTADGVFDNKGNFWGIQGYIPNIQTLYNIPAEQIKSDDFKVEGGYGIHIPRDQFQIEKDGRIFYSRKHDILMAVSSQWDNPVLFYNANGTLNPADDKYVTIQSFSDQDGREFSTFRYVCMAEDQNGRIWLGTSDGVVEITDPRTMFADNRIRRLKVSRNDGTNQADYLLSGQLILDISVDHANRKWIATAGNGVYLVSPDGDKILEHFTTDNSPLPSDIVEAVKVDPTSNKVYIGTPQGLAMYSASSSPSAPDYSEVVAYPNPVRPDFSGWITIKGLMGNSLVKITDVNGNIVFTTVSDGGMVTWDGCNTAGQRVGTGVYYVFASQKDGGSSSAVTKIMIVR